jgi:CRISPR-associated protein Cmr1
MMSMAPPHPGHCSHLDSIRRLRQPHPSRRRLVDGEWLPSVEYPEELEPTELRDEVSSALTRLFGRDVFAGGPSTTPYPSLSGSTLRIGRCLRRDQAQQAWVEALHWLRDFRQQPGFARERGTSRSRWPEADKLRHLNQVYDHEPQYDAVPAWPRASFGLPIVGRFVGKTTPPPFELIWRDAKGHEHDRAASPLIVKGLPLLQAFCPCTLWLARSYPEGQVALRGRSDSSAPFDFLGGETDRIKHRQLRAPIAGRARVKEAFVAWVAGRHGVVRVAP